MKMFIAVTNFFEGIHRYKDAPQQVDFLRNYHRHIFNIKTKIEVFHDDRELEFIMVKRNINNFINSCLNDEGYFFMENLSCEQFADKLYEYLIKEYGQRKITIEVSEDDENCAIFEGE